MGSAIRTLSGQRKKAHTPGLRIESVDAYPGRVYTHEPPERTRVVSDPEGVEAGLKSKGFGTALCACLNKSFPTVEAGRTKNRRNAPAEIMKNLAGRALLRMETIGNTRALPSCDTLYFLAAFSAIGFELMWSDCLSSATSSWNWGFWRKLFRLSSAVIPSTSL